MIPKQSIVGIVVNLLILVASAGLLLQVFATRLNQPHGELFFHIRIIIALCIVGAAFIFCLIVLYLWKCPSAFYLLPTGVVILWLMGSGWVLIPRPHYWGSVAIENRTGRMISTDQISSIGSGGTISCSGKPFGNSNSVLIFSWWYGTAKDRPADLRPMRIEYPPNASRGDWLTITIEQDGHVRLVATPKGQTPRLQAVGRGR